MHLLAHEVAHTVQQGSSPLRRRVVRRKLIPKALDAFNAAEAANSDYSTGRKDTDDLAAEADQEDLARVHGRMHTGKGSADERKVAHFVRAVVLSEYSARLRALETAVDTNGQPLSAAAKAKKKAVYKSKAEEFRKKHVPLVDKGSKAPETRGFLSEHGFGDAFVAESKAVKQTPQTARIDVRSTFIGAQILGMRMRSHLFIVYTAKDGRQLYFRGGPGPKPHEYTEADMGEYVPGTVDWDPSAHSVTLLEGPAAEAKLDALTEATGVIDRMQVPYQAMVGRQFGGARPNTAQKLLSTAAELTSGEGENCNATAWTILTRAGIAAKKPSGKHPGWGSILGSKTAGKENALPAAEVAGPGNPYVVDESRDVTDSNGMIQIYRDRNFFEPLIKIATGTKVTLLNESEEWRRISFGGDVGYVARYTEDYAYDMLPGWIEALKHEYGTTDLATIRDNPTDKALRKQVEQETGVPRDHVVQAATMALDTQGVTAALIWYRLDLLGKARVRELLSNPHEMARLAVNLGAKITDVIAVATKIVDVVELPAKVPVVLTKHLNDPNAANLACNEMPDYPTLFAVAAELNVKFEWLAKQVDKLRPANNRGNMIEQLLLADPLAIGELPNVAGYMLTKWANETGCSVDYLKQRCVAYHKMTVDEAARAKAKADADANAKKQAEEAAKARAAESGAKAGGAKAAVAEPAVDADTKQRIGLELVKLNVDDDGMWELVNDVPECAQLQEVADDFSVKLDVVFAIAQQYFPHHKGTLTLDGCLGKMKEETVRGVLLGTLSPTQLTTLKDGMCKFTGLPLEFIMARLGDWIDANWG